MEFITVEAFCSCSRFAPMLFFLARLGHFRGSKTSGGVNLVLPVTYCSDSMRLGSIVWQTCMLIGVVLYYELMKHWLNNGFLILLPWCHHVSLAILKPRGCVSFKHACGNLKDQLCVKKTWKRRSKEVIERKRYCGIDAAWQNVTSVKILGRSCVFIRRAWFASDVKLLTSSCC